MGESLTLSPSTEAAITAFDSAEKTRFLLEKKERDLRLATVRMACDAPNKDRIAYAEATEAILAKYESKREKRGSW